MLVFMGCLGISDLRNPGQWYCSEGDKDRKIFFLIEIFLLEVKNVFENDRIIHNESKNTMEFWMNLSFYLC